ncbi:MAG: histidine kinase, partial [Pseudomonadota bacterium]
MEYSEVLPEPTRAMRLSVPRILLHTAAFCTLVAVVLWLGVPAVGQYGFWPCFVHSQAIGLSTASLAVALATWLDKQGIDNKVIYVAAMGTATVVGFYFGMWLAALLLGFSDDTDFQPFDDGVFVVAATTAVIAGIALNWHFTRAHKLLELELEASEKARQAERAQHAMLQAQLEPHMLFNTLANLRILIEIDKDRAVSMLDRLDSFLRASLTSSQ